MSVSLDLTVDAGVNKNIQLEYLDPSTNLAISLSGYTAKMQIRERPGDVTVLVELTTENQGLIIDAPLGIITICFKPVDTTDKEWSQAFYDLYIVKTSDATRTRIAHGLVTILQGITQ